MAESEKEARNTDQKEPGKFPFGSNKRPFGGKMWWIYALIMAGVLAFSFFNSSSIPEITWQEFKSNMLLKGDVEKIVVVNDELARIYIHWERLAKEPHQALRGKKAKVDSTVIGPHYTLQIPTGEWLEGKIAELAEEDPSLADLPIKFEKEEDWLGGALTWLLPIGLLIFVWFFLFRRAGGGMGGQAGQMFNFGKAKVKMFDTDKGTQVTFNDVAGLEEAKEEVMEIVDFLRNPGHYTRLGAKIPRGVILVGPPGTGKTLLVKAVAGEAKVPFFTLSGSDFVEMFVGVGASRVRDLFKQAMAKAPCIVFIDEIDAIGRSRGRNIAMGANEERESTLNQLLSEMDGFTPNSGVIVMAATNRADVLDPALLRPGRFDRHIYLELPNFVERKAIFGVHLNPLRVEKAMDVEYLAAQTPGFSGADIANACNEAALIAARKEKDYVEMVDFREALDRIVAGLEKKSKVISPKEKNRIAHHEAGHAVVGWFSPEVAPLVKVSIIPRGKSLGSAWYLPEERNITTRKQFIQEMSMALGGRAAEEIVFGEVSSGALDDLEKVTRQAYAMVALYGLDEKLGNISYYDSSGRQANSFHKPYSEATAQLIDEEVRNTIAEAYEAAVEILKAHQPEFEQLASQLLEKEMLLKDDLVGILGERGGEA